MLNKVRIEGLDDYFKDLGKRRNKGVYFYRICGYNSAVYDFVKKLHEEARLHGVIIEGKLQNPDEKNLSYYSEIMGMDFQLDLNFITQRLRKWLPRMSLEQNNNVASSIYKTLVDLKNTGKNENVLKNIYIKFMCWLYYKFERIVNRLGDDKLPKILYEGEISNNALLLMNVLSLAGCDIAILQYNGEESYKKADPDLSMTLKLDIAGLVPFPQDFCLKKIRQDIMEDMNRERLLGAKPSFAACTNVWFEGKIIDELKKPPLSRGNDNKFFYNCFCRINGVEDKVTYLNELYQLQLELKNNNRRVVIVNNSIEPPNPEEVSRVRRGGNYQKADQLVMDMLPNLKSDFSGDLLRLVQTVFVEFIFSEIKKPNENLSKLMNKAVFLICWLRRFKALFENWKFPEVGCFFYMGGCRNDNEEMLCRFLSRLPVDVVIFNPDLNTACTLRDDKLYEEHYTDSLPVNEFPEANGGLRVGTAAYHAERELDTLMYQDSGLYRNNQYDKANAVSLQTMYEEIAILWDQELKFRPNFSTIEDIVNIPVIFAKVSGVKDSDINAYWAGIKKLVTQDTMVIKNIPYVHPGAANPMKSYATEFFRGGKLLRQKIKEHSAYQYGFLREPVQDHILDKLQALIDGKYIRGTFENGTEYTIIATVLNLEKNIVRMIQKFDFTKKNPKLIFIMTGENVLSLEDTIITAFLNLVGFDILFFVPTGYQCIEKQFAKEMVEEHQIGEYMYDLRIPDMNSIVANTRRRLRDKIFKRGK